MPLPNLFTAEHLRRRLSPMVVQRVFDDYESGTEDAEAISQLIEDASNKVRAMLGPVYDQALLDPATAPELRRLGLDVAYAMAAQRHPEVLRIDGFELMKQAERELKHVRSGISNLGVAADLTDSRSAPVVVSGTRRGW